MTATATRVRAHTLNPAAAPGDAQLSPAASGCSATGRPGGSAAARVALKLARMDMMSAARLLAVRGSEAQRLLSPSKPPLLGC